ncbi:MAG: hypothetical protein IH840_04415 [Candidatus Heimdallarchaeota archaeon]|nr:hypothetical protein [Candidatus Heimdallarchaeota archaeon]
MSRSRSEIHEFRENLIVTYLENIRQASFQDIANELYKSEKELGDSSLNKKSYHGPLTKRVIDRLLKKGEISRVFDPTGEIKHGYYKVVIDEYREYYRYQTSNFDSNLRGDIVGTIKVYREAENLCVLMQFDLQLSEKIEMLRRSEKLEKKLNLIHAVTQAILT